MAQPPARPNPDTRDIHSAIDAEIAKLQQAKAVLSEDSTVKRRAGRPAKVLPTGYNSVGAKTAKLAQRPEKGRTMSAAGRARIAAAQKGSVGKVEKDCEEGERVPRKSYRVQFRKESRHRERSPSTTGERG